MKLLKSTVLLFLCALLATSCANEQEEISNDVELQEAEKTQGSQLIKKFIEDYGLENIETLIKDGVSYSLNATYTSAEAEALINTYKKTMSYSEGFEGELYLDLTEDEHLELTKAIVEKLKAEMLEIYDDEVLELSEDDNLVSGKGKKKKKKKKKGKKKKKKKKGKKQDQGVQALTIGVDIVSSNLKSFKSKPAIAIFQKSSKDPNNRQVSYPFAVGHGFIEKTFQDHITRVSVYSDPVGTKKSGFSVSVWNENSKTNLGQNLNGFSRKTYLNFRFTKTGNSVFFNASKKQAIFNVKVKLK